MNCVTLKFLDQTDTPGFCTLLYYLIVYIYMHLVKFVMDRFLEEILSLVKAIIYKKKLNIINIDIWSLEF